MARETLAKVMPLVFKHEGGFTLHRADPGNWTGGKVGVGVLKGTKYGISAASFPTLDIKNITQAQATEIYRLHYWNMIRGDDLPKGIDYAVLDFAINSGVSRATFFLQRALKVEDDGIIGPETLDAARNADAVTVINDLCNARLAFLKTLDWTTFGKGWSARVASVRTEACRLAVEARASVPPDIVPVPPKPTTAPPRGFFHALGKLVEAFLSIFKKG